MKQKLYKKIKNDKIVLLLEKYVFDVIQFFKNIFYQYVSSKYYDLRFNLKQLKYWIPILWKYEISPYGSECIITLMKYQLINSFNLMTSEKYKNYHEGQEDTVNEIRKAIKILKRIDRDNYSNIAERKFLKKYGEYLFDINSSWSADDLRNGCKQFAIKRENEHFYSEAEYLNDLTQANLFENELRNKDEKFVFNFIAENYKKWWI